MMKKFACLALALLMILPLVLSSCGNEMTPEEIANANFREAEKALTLSLWIPTDAVVDEKFELRLQAVEASINDYLRSNNYSTKLDIVAINEAEYNEKLTQRFAEIKEAEKTNGTAFATADKYINSAIKNELTGIYEMAYPKVLDTQLDIFFVGGYDNYITYVNNGDTYSLDKFFVEGQVYNGLFKKIRSIFMDASKVNGSYHAIPNNHVYSESAQYVLINKALYEEHAEAQWSEDIDLYALQDYIVKVGGLGLADVVPYVGTGDDIPGVVHLDKKNLISASISSGYQDSKTGKMIYTPKFLYELDEYKSYMSFYKNLKDLSFTADTLDEGKTAAVQVITTNEIELENYKDEYYVIETVPPFVDIESMYSSMFAISSHSANYERAMQILYLLQDNVEVRTMLQYGVEGVDFDIILNENEENVIRVNNTGYKMNLLYTGNCYRTYPAEGVPMSYWDSVKDFNYKVAIHPFFSYECAKIAGSFSDDDINGLNNYLGLTADKIALIKSAFEGMTAEEFANVFEAIKNSASTIEARITGAQTQLDNAVAAYEAAVEAYNNAVETEEKEAALANMEKCEQDVADKTEALNKWTNLKPYVLQFADLKTAIDSKDLSNLLKQYKALYDKVK